MKRIIYFICMSLCFINIILADESRDKMQTSQNPIEIIDFLNNKTIFDTPAKKHIFLSFCEVIPMLDIWEDSVGLSQHVYTTPLLKESNKFIDTIPKVSGGSGSTLNIEVLKKLKPDVVIVWAGKKENINFIRNNGIKILAFYPDNIDEVYRDIMSIAKVLGKENLAKEKIQKAQKIKHLIEQKNKTIKHKKRAAYIWNKPNKIAGQGGMIGDMLKIIGVKNIGDWSKQDSVEINIEKLLILDPEVIFIWGASPYTPQDIINNPQLKRITAVKNKAIYKIPLWDNWGPRIIETALLSASLAYPNEYKDINVDGIIKDLNINFFGIDVR